MRILLGTVICALFLASVVGCQATGVQRAGGTVSTLDEIHDELGTAKVQVDKTMTALRDLTGGEGKLAKGYDRYVDELSSLDQCATRIHELREDAKEHKDTFLQSWQVKLKEISDEDLRQRAEERREHVVSSFEKLASLGDSASQTYKTLYKELGNLKAYLEHDLNPSGVQSVTDKIEGAGKEAEGLKTQIDEIRAELQKFSRAIDTAREKKS